MKIVSIISALVVLAFSGYSQPDPAVYYAASRLDYYTNEEVGEVVVSVPESLKGHKITIDLVFELSGLTGLFLFLQLVSLPYLFI